MDSIRQLLTEKIDFVALVAGTLIVFGMIHLRFWRGRREARTPWGLWVLAISILVGGWYFVEASVRHEWHLMREMVAGYAPTFAAEAQRLRHQEITLQTSPDDTVYWNLIQAQKRWLTVNPSISDIYTLRKLNDGRIVFIVDSETDYNRDGKFEGERETRTPIGEVTEPGLEAAVEKVYKGDPAFQAEPYTNKWGTWISALVPLRDFKGRVEGGLAVDFDAASWVTAGQRARRNSVCVIGVLLLCLAGAGSVLGHQETTRLLESKIRNQEAVGIEKQKLETLVNSIDGIVWERDAVTLRYTFVSQQSERLLGFPPDRWLAEDFWATRLHPEDQGARAQCAKLVAEKAPYSVSYRMIAADGRTVWIRENAAVLVDASGKPRLVRGVLYDITAQKAAAEELEKAHAALVDSSRLAGMAEVATGVLHNVGNVLNSVNVSGNVISERLRRSKSIELGKVAGLLTLQAADFAGFVARDPRGPHIPELISCISAALKAEHAELLEEVESITRNIAHIKEIVSMQQGFAKGSGIVEPISIQSVVDDAIKINAVSLSRHRISVVQAYEEVPRVLADKHLVLQILVNLLRNAKQAIESSNIEPRRIVVKIRGGDGEFVRISVQDSGTGIAAENLTRIFSHGFTTKKSGHGFGLHSSALAATGMGGSLNVHSDGPGTGATFILDLPIHQPVPISAAA